uniref:Uncharacterized protein n=1 Tax=Anguilla anguilla TaxID=7936 RepID=A0A0E9V4G0_ANGAN
MGNRRCRAGLKGCTARARSCHLCS